MRIPDWLVYSAVLAVIAATLFIIAQGRGGLIASPFGTAYAAPGFAAGGTAAEAPFLAKPNPFDERIQIRVGNAEDGVGTAFAINKSGAWLTARHVVDGCAYVALAVGDGRMVPVEEVRPSRESDLALLITDRAPTQMSIGPDREFRVGEAGY